MAPQWVSDGSPELSLVGNVATCTVGSSSGNVFNALWEEDAGGVTAGQHYWRIKNVNADIFVGVTDKEKFKQGWAIKGLMYGGNLSNGSGLVVGDFGPRINGGDNVGIFVSFENDNIKVYFDVNGSSLGLAFDLPKSIFKGVFPVVHFSGPGSVEIEKVNKVPSLVRPAVTHVGIVGDWKLVELESNGAAVPLPTSVTLRLTKKSDAPEAYLASFGVVNHLNSSIRRQDASSPWEGGQCMSTLMAGPPDHMALESQVSGLPSNPTKVELDGAALVWTNDTASLASRWERYTIEKQPVTENPFH